MITKQQLEQYVSLKREIAMLESQIYEAEAAGAIATDSVKASGSAIPYAIHNMTITGYATCHAPKLHKRKAILEAECTAIENYIEEVDDSIIRQLLTRRYIEGKSLVQSAQLVGYSTRQGIRLLTSYFEKMSPNVT